jgi:hypothetical protein
MPDFVMPNPNPNLLRLPIDGQLERSVTRPRDVDTYVWQWDFDLVYLQKWTSQSIEA